jgi:hypothetical protein
MRRVETDHFTSDDELPGFGLRIFQFARRSCLVQYLAAPVVR